MIKISRLVVFGSLMLSAMAASAATYTSTFPGMDGRLINRSPIPFEKLKVRGVFFCFDNDRRCAPAVNEVFVPIDANGRFHLAPITYTVQASGGSLRTYRIELVLPDGRTSELKNYLVYSDNNFGTDDAPPLYTLLHVPEAYIPINIPGEMTLKQYIERNQISELRLAVLDSFNLNFTRGFRRPANSHDPVVNPCFLNSKTVDGNQRGRTWEYVPEMYCTERGDKSAKDPRVAIYAWGSSPLAITRSWITQARQQDPRGEKVTVKISELSKTGDKMTVIPLLGNAEEFQNSGR